MKIEWIEDTRQIIIIISIDIYFIFFLLLHSSFIFIKYMEIFIYLVYK